MPSKPGVTPVKRPKTLKYSEEDMLAACRTYHKNGRRLREAARLHGVPPSTLRNRLQGKQSIKEVPKTVLTVAEEERLEQWIIECARRGFGRTMSQVHEEVKKILDDRGATTLFANNRPGDTWSEMFLSRHPGLRSRLPQALGKQRATVTMEKIYGWFEHAEKEISELGGDVLSHPSRIFNCDETGFKLGGSTHERVLASKDDRQTYTVTTDTHTQLTVLVAGSASGEVLQPLIIFPGKRFHYNPLEGFPEAHFAKSGNGWIDSEIFATWLRTVFVPSTKHLTKPVLLFADGHTTHATMTVSDICREHNIILYQLPSHASHIVQPLDLTTFKKLKSAWGRAVREFQEKHSEVVGKKEFASVFRKAWENGIDRDNVVSGFRVAGIYPWDPSHVDMRKTGPSRAFCKTSDQKTATEDDNTRLMTNWNEILTVTETATTSAAPSTSFANIASPTHLHDLTPNPASSSSFPDLAISGPDGDADISVQDDITSCPPSPSYPPAIPPLSSFLPGVPSSLDATSSTPSVNPASLSAQNTLPSVLTSSSVTPPSVSSANTFLTSVSSPPVATSSGSGPANLSDLEALDRLLDVVASAGIQGLVDYRTSHSLGADTTDLKESLFRQYYTRLRTCLTGNDSDRTVCTFKNLPLPSLWKDKEKKRTVLQPPKMVNSDSFRDFVQATEEKKRKIVEDTEKRKKEREEKKKQKEEEKRKKDEEKERKKQEMEIKKKENERMQKEKKAVQKQKKGKVGDKEMKRKRQEATSVEKEVKRKRQEATRVDTDADNDSLTSSKCIDDNSDIDLTSLLDDINVCSVCVGEKDDLLVDWVSCDRCGKWFHVGCVSVTDDSLRGKSMNEIQSLTYICHQCLKSD